MLLSVVVVLEIKHNGSRVHSHKIQLVIKKADIGINALNNIKCKCSDTLVVQQKGIRPVKNILQFLAELRKARQKDTEISSNSSRSHHHS